MSRFLNQRIFSVNIPSKSSLINLTQVRTSFYNQYKHGPTALSNPPKPVLKWIREIFSRDSVDFLKSEAIRFKKALTRFHFFEFPVKGKLVIFEDFASEESILKWKPVADSDFLNGYSSSNFSRSAAGHGLFHGTLDNRIPDDGATMLSGFTGIMGPTAPKQGVARMESFWDWTLYNTLEIKFRGDGRKYQVVLNTGTYTSDLQYYDTYGYLLYTRGGPYWQTIRIPFSKFIFCNKSVIQDGQPPLPRRQVKFLCINLADTYDGPFNLEIDYIGLKYEQANDFEQSAYESYVFPHIRYRPVNVDCPPPEHRPV